MKAIAILVIVFASILVGVKCLSIQLDGAAKDASAAQHLAYEQAKDAKLSDACAKGYTGIVTFYKGRFCGQ